MRGEQNTSDSNIDCAKERSRGAPHAPSVRRLALGTSASEPGESILARSPLIVLLVKLDVYPDKIVKNIGMEGGNLATLRE